MVPKDRREFEEALIEYARQGEELLLKLRAQFKPGARFVFFGAGGFAGRLFQEFKKRNLSVHAFVDRDPSKWGQMKEGAPILSPAEAVEFGQRGDIAVISVCGHAVRYTELEEIARNAGFSTILPGVGLFWVDSESLLPYFGYSLPYQIVEKRAYFGKAFELFEEPKSRENYFREVAWRASFNFSLANHSEVETQYFIPQIRLLGRDEIMVDGGAFDGDSLRAYLKRVPEGFRRWYAFEPDTQNSKKLQSLHGDWIEKEKLKVFEYALSDHEGKMSFTSGLGTQSGATESGNCEISMMELDRLVHEPITYFKLDVEGGEKSAILGALKILHQSPEAILAISSYHKPDDLWELPLWISKEFPQRISLCRSHGHFGFDFVYYLVPKTRIVSKLSGV